MSSYKTLSQTGADWHPTKIASPAEQVVAVNPSVSYNVLAHNVPFEGSGYLRIPHAYNEVFGPDQCGYQFVDRKCQ